MSGSRSNQLGRVLLPTFVLLLLLTPAAPAQELPSTDDENFYAANVIPQNSSARVDYLGTVQIPLQIEDASQQFNEQAPRFTHQIRLSAQVLGNTSETRGWAATVDDIRIPTEPGDVHQANLLVTAGAQTNTYEVEVQVQAIYVPSTTGEPVVTNATVLVQANPFHAVSVLTADFPDSFSPDEHKQIPITVSNRNYYPETVTLRVSDAEGWVVSPPSSISLSPGETKTVFVDLRADDTPWFRYTTTTDIVFVEAYSETAERTVSSTTIPLSLSGSTLQPWVTPHIVLLLLGFATVAYRSGRKVREHGLQRGKPSYPGLPPAKEAEFEALKIQDPEKGEEVEERLEVAYDRRLEAWKAAYAKRKDTENELEERYRERHDVLVDRRDRDEPTSDEVREHRRDLLQKKKDLLERKRDRLDEDGTESST